MSQTPSPPSRDPDEALRGELVALETGFWSNGPQYYRENLSATCLMVFEGMAGLFSSEEIARTVKGGPRWRNVDMEVKAFLRLRPEFVLLTYAASAVGRGNRPYSALVSSGYLQAGGKWRLSFHQQTPVNSGGAAPGSTA
jgi:hypothetical protein